MHCDRMTYQVGKDPPLCKLRIPLRGACNSALQSVGEAYARECSAGSTGKQRFVIGPGVLSQLALQVLGGAAPQGYGTFFPALPADANPLRYRTSVAH
jgi:hypothetical protein